MSGKKVVLVSGSSGGIGRAVCRKFAEGGWIAVGADLTDSEFTQHVGDLTDVARVEEILAAGSERARREANETLDRMKSAMGLRFL
jgi:NAD(P)-dependent dehydrogenase (short-subunit alcohol dehydrogenase family)